jgi:hypothetical protein
MCSSERREDHRSAGRRDDCCLRHFEGTNERNARVAPHDGDDFDHHDHQEADGTDIKQHTASHLGFHRIHAHAPSIRALMRGRPASPVIVSM